MLAAINTFSIATQRTFIPVIDYLLVSGGGGGGMDFGGGGGAGGLNTGSLTLQTTITYVVTVGAGGPGAS